MLRLPIQMRVEIDGYARDLWFIFVALLLLLLIILWFRHRNGSYIACCFVFGIYVIIVLDQVFFPIIISGGFAEMMRELPSRLSINLIPFYFGYSSFADSVTTLALNVLLTIPFGFGLSFLMNLKARTFLWLALAMGLWIEGMQLVISLLLRYPYRFIDINDVLMNGLGVLIGYAIFISFAWLLRWVTQHYGLKYEGFAAYIYRIARQQAKNG